MKSVSSSNLHLKVLYRVKFNLAVVPSSVRVSFLSAKSPEWSRTHFIFLWKVLYCKQFVMSQRAPFRQYYMPGICLTCNACSMQCVTSPLDHVYGRATHHFLQKPLYRRVKSAVFSRAVITVSNGCFPSTSCI